MDWQPIIHRLTQNSTWRGAILLVAAVATAFQPEHAPGILAAALGLVGAINVARNT